MLVVCLKRNGEEISYGELWKTIKSKERTNLTPLEKSKLIVSELNDLLPNACLKQGTLYYFVKEVA